MARYHSNTSHVFIYPMLRQLISKWGINSNTSHVFIYLMKNVKDQVYAAYSNTSHVFIYRTCFTNKMYAPFIFKYIPCFYLSATGAIILNQKCIQIHPMFLFIPPIKLRLPPSLSFKYIPCFYLSTRKKALPVIALYSNTSHVFIYRIS